MADDTRMVPDPTMLPPIDLITGRCPELIAESITTSAHTSL